MLNLLNQRRADEYFPSERVFLVIDRRRRRREIANFTGTFTIPPEVWPSSHTQLRPATLG